MSLQDDFHGELLRAATEHNESVRRVADEAQAVAEQEALTKAELQKMQPLICGAMRKDAQTFALTMLELGKSPTYRDSYAKLGPSGLGKFTLSGLRAEYHMSKGLWQKPPHAWPVKAFIKFGLEVVNESRYEGPNPRKTRTPVAIFIDVDGSIFSESSDTNGEKVESDWLPISIEQYRKYSGHHTQVTQVARYEVSDGFMAPIERIDAGIGAIEEQPLVIEWKSQLKSAMLAE